jgi:hypothetical protein
VLVHQGITYIILFIVSWINSFQCYRRSSLGLSSSHEPVPLPAENPAVKKHWRDIVMHQGWLLKQGGIGMATTKQWIKRYFVLYSTSQGHFLVYYSDLLEIPLYTTEHIHRNVVDLAKATFLRPGSNLDAEESRPPHCFDIVTTEREWTLCAETQENSNKWLKLLTRAVDEDVAILPDEELEFKVKPKVDALGVFNQQDYSTTIRVSANAVTVTAPDPPGSFNEKQQCFWVYTDFYKWSLLSQNGKIALLINVFTDATFQRRHEFIFRSKEAVRLATAIEFFIEKFMTVMHIRLELADGADAQIAAQVAQESLQHAGADEWVDDAAIPTKEMDLLGFDNDVPPPAPPTNQNTANRQVDFFSESAPPAPPANKQVDIFGDDPFGFGSPAAPPAPTGPTKYPPLNSAQIAQHGAWMRAGLVAHQGPIYDDAILQVAYKLEVRGSQGRLTFLIKNASTSASLSDLSITIQDPSGLLRFESGPVNATLAPLGQQQVQVMMECMKPVFPGPTMSVHYKSSTNEIRDESVQLPVSVTCFLEPITMNATDFASKWQALHGDQETMEVVTSQNAFTAAQVTHAVTSVCISISIIYLYLKSIC